MERVFSAFLGDWLHTRPRRPDRTRSPGGHFRLPEQVVQAWARGIAPIAATTDAMLRLQLKRQRSAIRLWW